MFEWIISTIFFDGVEIVVRIAFVQFIVTTMFLIFIINIDRAHETLVKLVEDLRNSNSYSSDCRVPISNILGTRNIAKEYNNHHATIFNLLHETGLYADVAKIIIDYSRYNDTVNIMDDDFENSISQFRLMMIEKKDDRFSVVATINGINPLCILFPAHLRKVSVKNTKTFYKNLGILELLFFYLLRQEKLAPKESKMLDKFIKKSNRRQNLTNSSSQFTCINGSEKLFYSNQILLHENFSLVSYRYHSIRFLFHPCD
jgi:hypothetical protein